MEPADWDEVMEGLERDIIEHASLWAALAALGNVYQNPETGEKVVVRGPKTAEQVKGWTKIADEPHGDGDFSYICGSAFCRCMA